MKEKKIYKSKLIADFKGYLGLEDSKEFEKMLSHLRRKGILKGKTSPSYIESPAQYYESKKGIQCNCNPVIFTATCKINDFFKGKSVKILTVKNYNNPDGDIDGLRVTFEEV